MFVLAAWEMWIPGSCRLGHGHCSEGEISTLKLILTLWFRHLMFLLFISRMSFYLTIVGISNEKFGAFLVSQMVENPPAIQETSVWKIPWRREWQPTLVFLPGESHGQRSLVSNSLCDHKESDTTEWQTHSVRILILRNNTCFHGCFPLGQGNGRSVWCETKSLSIALLV